VSSALLDAPITLLASAGRAAAAGGRRTTLEELLEGRWRSAQSGGETECPVCQATMRLEDGMARCGGCGTTLS
jgi:hypothetical protein